MTGDDLGFSRRDLLKGGGALVIGFSLSGPAASLAADAVDGLPGVPDAKAIDTWIAIHADNSATIYYGKCELGQGNTTGMLQIAGEELDMDLAQLSTVRLETGLTPNQGATSSSSSIERGGQIHHHARRFAGLVRGKERPCASTRAASPAAGLHRRADAPLRLLPQRHADQGL